MNAKLTLATVAGAAVLVIPGAGLIQSAVAADSGSGAATNELQSPRFVPVQEERQPNPQRPEDCPEKDGRGGGSGADRGAESDGAGTAL